MNCNNKKISYFFPIVFSLFSEDQRNRERAKGELLIKLHIDLIIQVIIGACFLLLSTVLLSIFTPEKQISDQVNSEISYGDRISFYSSLAVFLGLGYTAYNIHSQSHLNKRIKSSKYIEEWYSDQSLKYLSCSREILKKSLEYIQEDRGSFLKLHENKLKKMQVLALLNLLPLSEVEAYVSSIKDKTIKNYLEEIKINNLYEKDYKKLEQNKQSIRRICEFFEQMGLDVKLNSTDENYLKEFFYIIVINYYELYKLFICYRNRRHDKESRIVYCNFVYLAELWKNHRLPPTADKICDICYRDELYPINYNKKMVEAFQLGILAFLKGSKIFGLSLFWVMLFQKWNAFKIG